MPYGLWGKAATDMENRSEMREIKVRARWRRLAPVLLMAAMTSGVYLSACIFAVVSGKIAFLNDKVDFLQEHFAFLGAFAGCWFLHGTLAAAVFSVSLYGLTEPWMRRSAPSYIVLDFIIAETVLVLFGLGIVGMLVLASIVFVYMILHLPGMVGRELALRPEFAGGCGKDGNAGEPAGLGESGVDSVDGVNSVDSASPKDEESLSRRRLHLAECMHLYPLKKTALVVGLLTFGAAATVWLVGHLTPTDIRNYMIFMGCLAAEAYMIRTYVTTPYHSIIYLGGQLTRKQAQSLLCGESFEAVPVEDEGLRRCAPILLGENWLLMEGTLYSRKMAYILDVNTFMGKPRIEVTFLDGKTKRSKVFSRRLKESGMAELRRILGEITQNSFSCAHFNKKREILLRLYDDFFPLECEAGDRLWYLLNNDVSRLKADYDEVLMAKVRSRRLGEYVYKSRHKARSLRACGDKAAVASVERQARKG